MPLFKKKENDDISIIDDVKEPFSWSVFWDEKIVGKWKAFRKFLDEKGILFFLMSPFQYRNRLITKLIIIFLGVLLGVVPRSINLIDAAKERNAANEMATIMDKTFSTGSIMIKPLASGHYEKTHVLVFNISGHTKDGVPSTTSGFKVDLMALRGVVDEANVRYRYKVVPVDIENRLMIVYVDHSKQNDKTGIFGLDIHVKGESPMPTPMEVVLSDSQDETDIFKDGVINLSSLSNQIGIAPKEAPIKDAEAELKEAVDVYRINEERLKESSIVASVSTRQVEEYIEANSIFSTLRDNTTTKEAVELPFENITLPELSVTLTIGGTVYDEETLKGNGVGDESPQEANVTDPNLELARKEYQIVRDQLNTIVNNVSLLNNARTTKYNALLGMSNVLNSDVDIDSMKDGGTVSIGAEKE